MNNSLSDILTLEVTRKEFLIKLFIILIAITGISSIFEKLFHSKTINKSKGNSTGFGGGPYGR